uniref:Uncharacterized protein n=1 Tax=Anguilla anguilla TaxID=7936 RepID=A0A0E9RYW5_ANGAN
MLSEQHHEHRVAIAAIVTGKSPFSMMSLIRPGRTGNQKTREAEDGNATEGEDKGKNLQKGPSAGLQITKHRERNNGKQQRSAVLKA